MLYITSNLTVAQLHEGAKQVHRDALFRRIRDGGGQIVDDWPQSWGIGVSSLNLGPILPAETSKYMPPVVKGQWTLDREVETAANAVVPMPTDAELQALNNSATAMNALTHLDVLEEMEIDLRLNSQLTNLNSEPHFMDQFNDILPFVNTPPTTNTPHTHMHTTHTNDVSWDFNDPMEDNTFGEDNEDIADPNAFRFT